MRLERNDAPLQQIKRSRSQEVFTFRLLFSSTEPNLADNAFKLQKMKRVDTSTQALVIDVSVKGHLTAKHR